jgi:drug/metabolite transporter (DMT)-like permease
VTAFTLGLVLASALVHATWNLWAKELGPAARTAPLMWILTALSAVAYAPVALWMFAHGAWRPSAHALAFVAGSAVIHMVYFLLLLRGYRVGDLSLVYPVARGTGPLLAFVGALALLHERATPLAIVGALLVATGVLVLAGRPAPAGGRLAPGLRYGLATGVLIAGYTLWDGWAVKRVGIPPLLFYWGGEVVRTVLFTPGALADRDGVRALWRASRARVLGIALLSPFSYILVLIAMRTGAVSHIAPAREIAILIGAWLGGRVLGEGDRARRRFAAAAFAAGVIALAFAR